MVNLLYNVLYGKSRERKFAFKVITKSRQLSNYCQESVKPASSRKYIDALTDIDRADAFAADSLELISNAIVADNARKAILDNDNIEEREVQPDDPPYMQLIDVIEHQG